MARSRVEQLQFGSNGHPSPRTSRILVQWAFYGNCFVETTKAIFRRLFPIPETIKWHRNPFFRHPFSLPIVDPQPKFTQ